MRTFSIEEIDQIKVNNEDWSLTADDPANCAIGITGLEAFAKRALDLDENWDVSSYAVVDAVNRIANKVWFIAQSNCPEVHDRGMTLELSHNEGRLIFIKMMKGNVKFIDFINEIATRQALKDNHDNKELWWSIKASDSMNLHTNTYCLQGDFNDCKRVIHQIALDDKQKYHNGSCLKVPKADGDFTEEFEGPNKIGLKAQSYFSVPPCETELTVNYVATAKI